MASKHSAQQSFCFKWATFLKKLKLVQNTVRNSAVARNWPQVRLRNCRFAPNWNVLLGTLSLWETACATVLLIELDAFCEKAKTCQKHRAQLCCCSKLASKHSAQLSFCFKLTRIVGKPKPVKNAVHNFPVSLNSPQITLRNCCFASNWPLLLEI